MRRSIPIGPYTLWADDSTYVQQSILDNGLNYESHVIREWQRLVPVSKGFIDAGANVGFHTLVVKSINPTLPVMCFEPSPSNLVHLRENVASFQDVIVNPVALAGHHAQLFTNGDPDNTQCSYLGVDRDGKSWQSTTLVPCHRLDDYDTSPYDLIKLDIEGFEPAVLHHAPVFMSRRPTILFEFNTTLVHRSYVEPDVWLQWFVAQGYQLRLLNASHLLEWGLCDIVATPIEKT